MTLEPSSINFQAFQPLTENRFIVEWDGIPSFLFYKVTLPKFNGEFWDHIELELSNAVSPSTFQALNAVIKDYQNGRGIEFEIIMFGPVGDKVSQWHIVVGNLYVDFGQGDWFSSKNSVSKVRVIPSICKLIF